MINMRSVIYICLLSLCIASCSIRNHYSSVLNDPEFSKNNKGYIYTEESIGNSNASILKKYDIHKRQWIYVQKAPQFSSDQWDIKGNTFACILQNDILTRDNKISIFRMPEFLLIKRIDFLNPKYPFAVDSQKNTASFKLSPDETKLALLLIHSTTQSRKYDGDCYHFSPKCKLVILDVNTGEKLFESSNYFFGDHLDWSPDSKKVYVTSFRDQSLFEATTSDLCGSQGTKGVHYLKKNVFPEDVYSIDIETEKMLNIVEGTSPLLHSNGVEIYYGVWKKFYVYDIFKYDLRTNNRFTIGSVSSTVISAISPDGVWMIGNYSTDIPSESFSFIIDANDVNHRLILDNAMHRHFVWVEE